MKKTYNYFTICLLSINLAGMIYFYPSNTDSKNITLFTNKKNITSNYIAPPQGPIINDLHNSHHTSQYKQILKFNPVIVIVKKENMEFEPVIDTSRCLNEILAKFYGGTICPDEERALKRVLKWKDDFQSIAREYSHIDWRILAAIVKVETQGRTGEQISSKMAIGMPQIKYQGAWAFFWDAMYSKEIKHGSIYVKDYYNASIRSKYGLQLNRISQYLGEKEILVTPPELSKSALEYRQARFETWKNFKTFLEKDYQPGEYQVAVDIAAMYIDHLIDTFCKLRRHVEKVKLYFDQNQITNIEDIQVPGMKVLMINQIKEYLEKSAKYSEKRNMHALTLKHINRILYRIEDPDVYSYAYNFGPGNVLEYIFSGKKFPKSIEDYRIKVTTYNTIFTELNNSMFSSIPVKKENLKTAALF